MAVSCVAACCIKLTYDEGSDNFFSGYNVTVKLLMYRKKIHTDLHSSVTPYVNGVTKPVQRILTHHEIATAVIPHLNIRRIPRTMWKTAERLFIPNPLRQLQPHVFWRNRENILWKKNRGAQEQGGDRHMSHV